MEAFTDTLQFYQRHRVECLSWMLYVSLVMVKSLGQVLHFDDVINRLRKAEGMNFQKHRYSENMIASAYRCKIGSQRS
jgi:hypothetical protein